MLNCLRRLRGCEQQQKLVGNPDRRLVRRLDRAQPGDDSTEEAAYSVITTPTLDLGIERRSFEVARVDIWFPASSSDKAAIDAPSVKGWRA